MSRYLSFTKKEFMENTRNYRLFLITAIFLFFGVSSPLLAKFLPQIVEKFTMNMEISLQEPSALDAWTQYYKNVSSLGLSLTIILFSNCLSGEYTKGTLTIMFTKGLPRSAVILSKFIAAAVIMTVSYWISFFVTFEYISYLWKEDHLQHVILAGAALWITALLFLCILMLGCVLFRQAFTSILFLLIVTVIISLLGAAPLFEKITPFFLMTKNVDLLSGTVSAAQFGLPVIISVAASAIILMGAVIIFNRKQL